jgi:asparagine synthetase B (glutamine-hydrolysing)
MEGTIRTGECDTTAMTIKDDSCYYHIFFKGRIYNILSLTYMDDDNIRNVIFELYKRYDFNFKKMNNDLNGDYALVIIKEKEGKVQEINMSTDHIGNIKLYYYTKNDFIKFSSTPFFLPFGPTESEAFLMPAGFMCNIQLDEHGIIKQEMTMEYRV